MKTFLKKKQLMLVALVAALGLAVYLNYYLAGEPLLSAGTQEDSSTQESEPDRLGEATFVDAPVSKPESSDTDEKPDTAAGYFDTARKNRAAAREEALSILQEVLDNAQTSAQDKTAAAEEATAIAENVLRESNMENLIIAKGFADAVVYIDGDGCSVVVESTDLQQQESMQILEIVVSGTGISADKVQITAATA
ncbi:MAG: SpoIIIAH-like family protein [Clostridia bacterium]|nr:SpoIIIAH-like family protein [Clostridia bacterium]